MLPGESAAMKRAKTKASMDTGSSGLHQTNHSALQNFEGQSPHYVPWHQPAIPGTQATERGVDGSILLT